MEIGRPDRGPAPRLVEHFGSLITGLDADDEPMTAVLRQRLHRLDGAEFGTLVIAAQPGTPRSLDDFDAGTLGEYIQSAGDADAMTVEIRRPEADGVDRQYAVGRHEDEPGTRTVVWASTRSLEVPANEVFTADEAHPVYLQWCWDQSIPEGYLLRLLNI